MTTPRYCPKGSTYFISKRCWTGLRLLSPLPGVNQAFGYCLALATERCGIKLHGFIVMSNHWHGLVTDPEGRIDEFLCLLHSLVARTVNQLRERTDGLWSRRPTSLVRLETADSIMRSLTYLYTNPVAAELTRTGRAWPGLRGVVGVPGAHSGIQTRPKRFFQRDGPCPERARLSLTFPRAFVDDEASFCEKLRESIEARQSEIQARLKAEGRPFLGATAVRRQRWDGRSRKQPKRSRLSPTVASRDTEHRIHMLVQRAIFLQRYREAMSAWQSGQNPVVFPDGTVQMRRFPGVLIRAPDA